MLPCCCLPRSVEKLFWLKVAELVSSVAAVGYAQPVDVGLAVDAEQTQAVVVAVVLDVEPKVDLEQNFVVKVLGVEPASDEPTAMPGWQTAVVVGVGQSCCCLGRFVDISFAVDTRAVEVLLC